MQNVWPSAGHADIFRNESGAEYSFTGTYRHGDLKISCRSANFSAVEIVVQTETRQGARAQKNYVIPADGEMHAIELSFIDATGLARVTLKGNAVKPCPQYDGDESFEAPGLRPDEEQGASTDPVAQAGLSRAADALSQLLANEGLGKLDFRGFGRALKAGTQISGTLANAHAVYKTVAEDDWQTVWVVRPTVGLSTGSTAADLLAVGAEAFEKALKAGKNSQLATTAAGFGKLAGVAGGVLGLTADAGGFVNTAINYAQGEAGTHGINLAVDGSAVVGSAVALIPGFGPVGFLITVPAVLYTAADAFMLRPPLPDEQITDFKANVREAVEAVDAFMADELRKREELIEDWYEMYLDGLRRQCGDEDDTEAEEGYLEAKEQDLARLATRWPEFGKAARKGMVRAARKTVERRLDENRNSFLLGRIGPTRDLEMREFIEDRGWTLQSATATDPYWRDFTKLSMRNAIASLQDYSAEEIEEWAGREFSEWPGESDQPRKVYASWSPFG